MTSHCNEIMCLVYEFFTKSAATTRYTEMCKRKVREMIDLVEKDMAVGRDGDENENSFVANNVIDDAKKKNCSLNNLPILNLQCVRPKGITNAKIKSNLEKHKRKALKDVTRSTRSSKYFSF